MNYLSDVTSGKFQGTCRVGVSVTVPQIFLKQNVAAQQEVGKAVFCDYSELTIDLVDSNTTRQLIKEFASISGKYAGVLHYTNANGQGGTDWQPSGGGTPLGQLIFGNSFSNLNCRIGMNERQANIAFGTVNFDVSYCSGTAALL